MDDALTTLLVNGGIVAALLEASKRALGTHFDWSRYGAWLALIVGVVTAEAAVLLNWYGVAGVDYKQAVFAGLMAGITASGINRGVSQSPPAVVVEGQIPAAPAKPATATSPATPATPAVTATAVVTDPAVTADPTDPAVSPPLPVQPAPPPPAPSRPLPPEYGRLTPPPAWSDPGRRV